MRNIIDSMLFERIAISKEPEQVSEGENPLFGRILYAGKKEEQIELLELDRSGIHAAIELSSQRLETEGGHSCPPTEEEASKRLTTQRLTKTETRDLPAEAPKAKEGTDKDFQRVLERIEV